MFCGVPRIDHDVFGSYVCPADCIQREGMLDRFSTPRIGWEHHLLEWSSFHENRTLFLMRQGSYQDYFMFFCNFILLQSSYVFERLERHTAFLSRRYFERRERSINQVFDASILDCNHMLSSRQIFLRPNPPQFWNQRWRPNTKMCTRAPKIGPHCRSNLF